MENLFFSSQRQLLFDLSVFLEYLLKIDFIVCNIDEVVFQAILVDHDALGMFFLTNCFYWLSCYRVSIGC